MLQFGRILYRTAGEHVTSHINAELSASTKSTKSLAVDTPRLSDMGRGYFSKTARGST